MRLHLEPTTLSDACVQGKKVELLEAKPVTSEGSPQETRNATWSRLSMTTAPLSPAPQFVPRTSTRQAGVHPTTHQQKKKNMALTRVAEPFRAAGGAGGALEIDDGD